VPLLHTGTSGAHCMGIRHGTSPQMKKKETSEERVSLFVGLSQSETAEHFLRVQLFFLLQGMVELELSGNPARGITGQKPELAVHLAERQENAMFLQNRVIVFHSFVRKKQAGTDVTERSVCLHPSDRDAVLYASVNAAGEQSRMARSSSSSGAVPFRKTRSPLAYVSLRRREEVRCFPAAGSVLPGRRRGHGVPESINS